MGGERDPDFGQSRDGLCAYAGFFEVLIEWTFYQDYQVLFELWAIYLAGNWTVPGQPKSYRFVSPRWTSNKKLDNHQHWTFQISDFSVHLSQLLYCRNY